MSFAELEALHPGIRDYCRSSFVENECGSDEYRETQPAKGMGMIADWTERVDVPWEGPMMGLVARWVTVVSEGEGWYAGADELVPVLTIYFDFLWDRGEHPYFEPDELREWYEEIRADEVEHARRQQAKES
jgi:hypothetical protein